MAGPRFPSGAWTGNQKATTSHIRGAMFAAAPCLLLAYRRTQGQGSEPIPLLDAIQIMVTLVCLFV
jgi:hypothetical protein